MHIYDLPEELLDLCCDFLADRPTFRSLRLVSRCWLTPASKQLFRKVVLELDVESCERLSRIVSNEFLRPLVKDVCIDLCSEVVIKQLPLCFRLALQDIGGFSHLQRLSLKFDADVTAPSRRIFDVEHDLRTRNTVLSTLFEALHNRRSSSRSANQQRLKTLSIDNLQHTSDPLLMTSPPFTSTLSSLSSLSLRIATEFKRNSTERSSLYDDAHPFFDSHLSSHWLRPALPNLLSLKLYTDGQYWGHFPACDLCSLHFPRLKSLTLAKFTFVSDSQLEWILGHGDTLSSLVLDDCPIVFAGRSIVNTPKGRRNAEFDPGAFAWSYRSRWGDYLGRMREGLPVLRHFGWGYGRWEGDEEFDTSEELGAEVHFDRYVVYDALVERRSVWVNRIYTLEGGDPGCVGPPYRPWPGAPEHPDVDGVGRRDHSALGELMDAVRARRAVGGPVAAVG